MTAERAAKVFAILVRELKADPDKLDSFVYHTTHDCPEYRFMGILGYGGKYYPESNRVGYYREDITPALDEAVEYVNNLLGELK